MTAYALAIAVVAASLLGYGWFEAGWIRYRVLPVEINGLPPALEGLRIAHLSDFHLGRPSRGVVATKRAVAWVEERRPDVVVVTGDLVSHPRGEPLLRALLPRLGRPYVVLGNHDVATTRDPFSRQAELDDLAEAELLSDRAVVHEFRGERVAIVGVDPASYRNRTANPGALVERDASLRILLCHFPAVVPSIQPGLFHLILSGHLHAGQIVLPYPRGRVTLAHPGAKLTSGIYRVAAGVLHVSPGLGTTFVPFRFFARPEVTELVLRCRSREVQQSS